MLLKGLKYALYSFIELLFPVNCAGCNAPLQGEEKNLCLHCITNLPLTHNWKNRVNPTYKKMYGRFALEYANSFLYFTKSGLTQHLIHQFKYRNRKDLAVYLGYLFGQHLLKSTWINEIDTLLPIPLHPKKERQRGYNQSAHLALGITEATRIPTLEGVLIKAKNTPTQTRKSIIERVENVRDTFRVEDYAILKGKHILIVDDVLTTGSTIESAAFELLQIEDVKISFATLGVVLD